MMNEHVRELQFRIQIIAWVMFGAFLALGLLPDAVFGRILLGNAQPEFGRLTRLTWTVFGALLLAWTPWMYHIWRFTAPALDQHEQRRLQFFLFVLALSPYAVWYASKEILWPWLNSWLGQPQGISVWLGLDALSLLLKAQIILTALIALGIGPYRRFLWTWIFLGMTVGFLLLPPYLWAILLLLVIVLNNVWSRLTGRWKLILLVLPLVIGRNEIVQGMWPWGATILSGLFVLWIALARKVEPSIIKATQQQQRTEQFMSPHRSPIVKPEPEPPEVKPPPPRVTAPRPAIDHQAIQEMLAHLTGALQEQDPAIRNQAICGLGQAAAKESVELLIPFLDAGDQPQSVRLAAIQALGMLGGDKAIDALLSISADKDLAVRWQAQEVLDCLLAGRRLPSPRTTVILQDEPLVRVLS